ncbi:hypothetical protein [Paenibacillus albidus]|uniref:hypothetical protein n=1 Tax=Paenibacillus albidus TaxID=2041023 RepID=UPI00405899D3
MESGSPGSIFSGIVLRLSDLRTDKHFFIGSRRHPGDDTGARATDAIVAANKTGSIIIASSNLSPVGIDYMKRGLIAFETAGKMVVQGKAAVEQAL